MADTHSHTLAVAKDKAKLAVAAVKGEETQDLYVAVTKATLPTEVVPKEKHVRTLRIACSAHSPRHVVEYVIYKLGKRLNSPSWVVACKALMTFHRLLRECDASFAEQLLRFADRTGRHHLLALDRFADHSSREAWDYSAFVRAYGMYLDQRLEAFRTMRFDPEGNVAAQQQQHLQQLHQQQQQHLQQQQYASAGGAAAPCSNGGSAAPPPPGSYGSPTTGGGAPPGSAYSGPTGGGAPPSAYSGPTGGGAPPSAYSGPTGGGAPPGSYGGAPAAANGYGAPHSYGAPSYGGAMAPHAPHAAPLLPVRLKDCPAAELLQHLPTMQRLMARLLAVVPEGASAHHPMVLTACAWVLRESRAVYKAASEGVINLADKFFEMDRAQAQQGVQLYRDNLALAERLGQYYAAMQALPALSNVISFPHLAPLPADFLTAMEEYARDAPHDAAEAEARREGGPPGGATLSGAAARGGATSAALEGPPGEGGEVGEEDAEAAEAAQRAAAEEAERAAAEEAAPAAAERERSERERAAAAEAAAAAARNIDLLSFDDDEQQQQQQQQQQQPAAAAAGPNGELDFLADGMQPGGQQQQPQQQQQQPQQQPDPQQQAYQQQQQQQMYGQQPPPPPGYYGAYAGPTGGYSPYDPAAAAYYAAHNPYAAAYYGGHPAYAGPTGAPGHQLAIVPVGVGGAMVPYGLPGVGGPFSPPGAVGVAPGSNNPFLSAPAAAAPAAPVGPVRMADDPLNALTDELLGGGGGVQKKQQDAAAAAAPQPTLNDIKRASQRTIASPSPVGGGGSEQPPQL